MTGFRLSLLLLRGNKMWLFLIFIVVASVIFGAITTLPLALVVILCLSVIFKNNFSVFALAFFMGLYLDIILVRTLGQSSTFFVVFIFLVFLYERKFEIQTAPFVFLSSFFGTLSYLFIFGYNHVLEQAVVSSVIGVLLFRLLTIAFKYQK